MGLYQVRLIVPEGYTQEMGRAAEEWWMDNVNGTRYDFLAYPRLMWKAYVGDWWGKAAGLEWNYWCSEGVRSAYAKTCPAMDVWGKSNPTPKTTEKRFNEEKFLDMTYMAF